MNRDDWTVFVILVMFAICVGGFIGGILTQSKMQEREFNKHILLETNSIGCQRWKYNDDRYWKCPKDVDTNSFDIKIGKKTHNEPVVGDVDE